MATMIAKPTIPQTRIRFRGSTSPRITPSLGETVAIPLTHDWGPLGTELTKPVPIASFDEWLSLYGDSDTPGRTAVAEAFVGQGLDGAGGAGGVIPYRMGVGALRSVLTVKNTGAVDAVKLTAKWAGTRGNSLSITIDVDPNDSSRDRLRIRYLGAVVETFSYTAADIASLVAAINSRSAWVTAGAPSSGSVVTGTRLTATASTSLATGSNGNTITSADYLAALDALEFQPFSFLAPFDLTDSATQAAILSWVRTQEDAGRPVIYGVGGAAGEVIDSAVTRAQALADPHVVNIGVGTYFDDLLQRQVSTSQLVPRIMGVLAARGTSTALTGAELGGLHVVGTSGPSSDDAKTAIANGVTVFIRTDSDDADLRVAKGVTTFTSTTDPDRPVGIFSEPRFIRIMDQFIRDMRRWGDKVIVGVPVNDDTRDAVRQYGGQLIDALLRDGLILTAAEGADSDPFISTPVTTDDTVPFDFGWQFAKTANFLLGSGTVR